MQAKTIINEGATINTANISGGNVAARDLYQIDHVNMVPDSQNLFAELSEDAGINTRLVPGFCSRLLDSLRKDKVLILAGGERYDKGELALLLATAIRQEEPSRRAFEFNQNAENTEILAPLRQLGRRRVCVLEDLHPGHFRHDLPRLVALASELDQLLIIATDLEKNSWGGNSGILPRHWVALPDDGWYSAEQLGQLLHTRTCELITESDPTQELPTYQTGLLSGVPYLAVASKLETPVQIELFARLFHSSADKTQTAVNRLVNALLNEQRSLFSKWYLNLGHNQKVIALAAGLLNGLFDDQFFATVDLLAKDPFWRMSSGAVLALDYHHLEFLSPFFRFEVTRHGTKLVARHDHLREELVRSLWKGERRQLLKALPIFKTQAAASLRRDSKNWELFGTAERRSVFRETFEKAIGEIALVSYSTVEPTMLELAATGNYYVQLLVARSMARWRAMGHDARLFKTLSAWRQDNVVQEQIRVYLQRRQTNLLQEGLNQNSVAYIRSTAVITLSYAATFDAPNALSDELVALLKELATDNDPQVKDRIVKALPKIIRTHALQLRHILMEDFMVYDHLSRPVSQGLIAAHEVFPEEIKNALLRWMQACTKQSSNDNRRQKFTQRDNVLITILLTIGDITLPSKGNGLSVDEVFSWYSWLLKHEGRRQVRSAVLESFVHLQARRFQASATYLELVLPTLNPTDILALRNHYFDLYCSQRKDLVQAPYIIQLGDDEYPAWLNMYERPFTPLEHGLFEWLTSSNIALQRFAAITFMYIANRFDRAERNKIAELRQFLANQEAAAAQNRARQTPTATTPVLPVRQRLGWWTEIRIFFMLLSRSKSEKIRLRNILLVLRYTNEYDRNDLQEVIFKWSRASAPIQKLGKWLQRLW